MESSNLKMSFAELDDGSIVVNFGLQGGEGGYVHFRNEDQLVTLTAFSKEGDVIYEKLFTEEELK